MRIFSLLLLAPLGAFAQSPPLCPDGGPDNFSNRLVRDANPLHLILMGTESLVISTGAGTSLPNFSFPYKKAMTPAEEGEMPDKNIPAIIRRRVNGKCYTIDIAYEIHGN